ncbi:MAG: hypothetical protein ABEK50_12130 [bacterium]
MKSKKPAIPAFRRCLFVALFLGVAFLSSLGPALANSSVFTGSGGNLIPLKESSLSIERENLRFTIGKRARVEVEFTIRNTGNPGTVTMGFVAKKAAEGGQYSDPKIRNFRTSVNGKTVDFSKSDLAGSKFSDIGIEFGHPLMVYKFQADLKNGQNTISHHYTIDPGRKYMIFNHQSYEYVLRTAHLWKGKTIKDFNITIDINSTPARVRVPAHLDRNKSGQWSGRTACSNDRSKYRRYLRSGWSSEVYCQ